MAILTRTQVQVVSDNAVYSTQEVSGKYLMKRASVKKVDCMSPIHAAISPYSSIWQGQTFGYIPWGFEVYQARRFSVRPHLFMSQMKGGGENCQNKQTEKNKNAGLHLQILPTLRIASKGGN